MIILAPMQGLTEVLFRKAYEQCFPKVIDLAISPFLSLTHGNLADAWKKIGDVLPENNTGSIPVIPQILGKEPQEFVELANRLHEVGYNEVNWNIGCPVRRVAGKHRGSGILPYPDEVKAVLDAVVPHLTLPLSIKMRLGLNSKEEILKLIPILNDYPLKNVTIHPRTGKQQYGGQVDLDAFEHVLPLFQHEVIYNGDICTLGDYRTIRKRFPTVNNVMIGRGVLYDPLLPVKIKAEEGLLEFHPEKERALVLNFIETLFAAVNSGPVSEVSKMRKTKEYWCLIRKSLPITEQQSQVVLHAQSPEETRDRIRELINSETSDERPNRI